MGADLDQPDAAPGTTPCARQSGKCRNEYVVRGSRATYASSFVQFRHQPLILGNSIGFSLLRVAGLSYDSCMFSELIIMYLFLGGTGAGCCLVASVLGLLADPEEVRTVLGLHMRSSQGCVWKRFFAALYLAALSALLLGAVCLMADTGRPDRILLLLTHPAPTYIAFGAWAIIACVLFAGIRLLIWSGVLPASSWMATALDALCIIASMAVIVYTGLMLSDVQAVPLWHTPWLVLLFALSGLSCGIALVLIASFASRTMELFASTLVRLVKIDAFVIVLEAVVSIFCLLSVWDTAGGLADPIGSTAQIARTSLESLLVGPFAVLFWTGFVFVGLAVPFVQDVIIGHTAQKLVAAGRMNRRVLFMLGTATCVLIGGFILRFLVVGAAMHPALLIS